jgi:hypothetical protein
MAYRLSLPDKLLMKYSRSPARWGLRKSRAANSDSILTIGLST